MNKFSKLFTLVLSCVIFLGAKELAYAQTASSYSFTQSVDTYTPIVNGTILSGAFGNYVDDDTFKVLLPKPFVYMGTTHNYIKISTNGHASFYATNGLNSVAKNTYTLINSSFTNFGGGIAVFSRDLGVSGNIATQPSFLHYTQIDDEFVIEWKNVRRYGVGSEIVNAQLRLNTSNGDIKIVYGECISGSNVNYPQVGLVGVSNSDFNNRVIEASGGSWINSATGTLNNISMYFNVATPTTKPEIGTTFTYSYPAGYTYPVACLYSAPISSQVAATSATFNFGSGNSVAEREYIIVSRGADVSTGIPVIFTTNTLYIQNLNQSTDYSVYFRTICNGNTSDWSPVVNITTTCQAQFPWSENFDAVNATSTLASYVVGQLPSCWSYLGDVTTMATNTYVNARSGDKALTIRSATLSGTGDWAFTPAFSLQSGETYRFSFWYRNPYSYGAVTSYVLDSLKIGIGRTANAASMSYIGTTVSAIPVGNYTQYVVDFTVPISAEYFLGLNLFEASTTLMYLSVDDMSLDFAPSCLEIIGTSSDILSNSAKITTTYSGISGQYIVVAENASISTGTPINFTGSIIDITNLNPITTYNVYLRQICSVGDTSNWSINPIVFTTACGAISNFPWTENFDNLSTTSTIATSTMPACWSRLGDLGVVTTSNAYLKVLSGTNALLVQNNTAVGTGDWVFTPNFQLQAGTSYRFRFYYANYNNLVFDTIRVGIGASQNASDMTIIGTPAYNIVNPTFQEYYVDFTVPNSGVYNLGINIWATNAPLYISIDNISLLETPTCLSITNSVDNILSNSALLSTNATASISQYIVIPTTADFSTGTPVTFNGATTTITNLLQNTAYKVYVRQICAIGDTSEWSMIPTQFTTPCAPISTLPWVENFDNISTTTSFTSGILPGCWSKIGDVGVVKLGSTNPRVYSDSNSLVVKYSTEAGTGDWAFTPGFELQTGVSYRFKFYYANSNAIAFDTLRVGIGTGTTVNAMTIIGTPVYSITNTTFREYYVDFTVPTTGVYYFGINVWANSSPYYLSFDDVTLMHTPTCVNITGSVSDTTATSVVLNTTYTGIGAEYVFANNIAGANSGTPVSFIGNSVTISNLVSNTTYSIYVRQICAIGDTSEWSVLPIIFTTKCAVITTLPWLENFDNVVTTTAISSNILPACWTRLGDVNVVKRSSFTPFKILSDSSALVVQSGTLASTGDWAFTPSFELQAGVSYRFKMYYANSRNIAFDTVRIAVGANTNIASMNFIGTPIYNVVDTTFQEYYVDFTVPNSGVYNLGINIWATNAPYYLSFDDLSLDYSPAICNNPIALQVSSTNICDNQLGTATVLATTNSTSTLDYLWSNGETTITINDLVSGRYIVTVTDGNLCTSIDSVDIAVTNLPTLTMNIIQEDCGNDIGIATVIASGANLVYNWSNGETTATVSGLGAGLYYVTVSENGICSVIDSITITNNNTLTLSTVLSPDCGIGTGRAEVIVSNIIDSSAIISYLWSNGETTAVAQELSVGNYTISVTQNNLCVVESTVTIGHQDAFSISGLVTDASCESCLNGIVSLNEPILDVSYLWSNGETTSEITNLAHGTYTVTVTDINGCIVTTSFEVDFVTSVNEVTLSLVKAYPNPTTDIVNIAGLPRDSKIMLVNNLGQIVQVFVSQNEIEQMDLSDLAPSTYWIRIENQSTNIVLPIVYKK